MIYATNPEFIKMIHFLCPGYKSPIRIDFGGKLLDTVHKNSLTSCSGLLHDQSVTINIDGWSNVHNEPAVCATIITMNSDIYLTDIINTPSHSHTSDYLVDVAVNSIKNIKNNLVVKFAV